MSSDGNAPSTAASAPVAAPLFAGNTPASTMQLHDAVAATASIDSATVIPTTRGALSLKGVPQQSPTAAPPPPQSTAFTSFRANVYLDVSNPCAPILPRQNITYTHPETNQVVTVSIGPTTLSANILSNGAGGREKHSRAPEGLAAI